MATESKIGCYFCKSSDGDVRLFPTVFGFGVCAHKECWNKEINALSGQEGWQAAEQVKGNEE